MKIRRMRIACWIPKATNTHSEYVILIDFPYYVTRTMSVLFLLRITVNVNIPSRHADFLNLIFLMCYVVVDCKKSLEAAFSCPDACAMQVHI